MNFSQSKKMAEQTSIPNHLETLNDYLLIINKADERASIPKRESDGAAGYDLTAIKDYVVPAHGKELVSTGLIMKVPKGTYGRIAPRSGLAWKHHIDVGAGVIDRDYRGVVRVVLFNHSDTDFKVSQGDRVAQLVLELILTPEVSTDYCLDETSRGQKGFGSTGV